MATYEHWKDARRVCVIGAGTMGSGIAAHLANIGFDVTLLDLTVESVQAAFDRAKAAKPPHFYVPGTAAKIRLGSITENLAWAAEADWVCEAIIEKLDAKRDLFAKLDAILPESVMVSTNTSGLQIELLTEGRSDQFKRKFLGTHFFNPPRYLKLLELIPTGDTDPAAVQAFTEFLEDACARRVVLAKDTPGFIANRFGMWSMFHAVHTAEKLGLTIEQVDAICGPFLGRPRSGAFRLNDIVGLDIMQDIANNLLARCSTDPFIDNLNTPRSLGTLMERGFIGAKTGSGYYKREGKELLALDLGTLAYRQLQEVDIPSLKEFSKLPFGDRINKTLDAKDEAGEFLRMHLIPVLQYANYLKEEISHNVQDFDRVMKWGFAWDHGPFETIDAIGHERLGITEGPFYDGGKLRSFSGAYVSPKPEPQYATLDDFPVIDQRPGLNIRDLGDGVHAVALTTKMGTINPQVVAEIHRLLDEKTIDRFVLTSEAKHFSAGFDLSFFQDRIQAEDWAGIDEALKELQRLNLRLGTVHSVAAIFGYCLGAGTELAIGCSRIAAHPDVTIGLPEVKVGLLPGGGGTALLAHRSQAGGAKHVVDVCMAVSTGFVSNCADDARRFDLLRSTDVTVYHPDRLLTEAKSLARELSITARDGWNLPAGPITGMIDQAQSELKAKGDFSDHDELIANHIKSVFSKANSLEHALDLERVGFEALCKQGLSAARIRHMLETGKPLRN